MKKQEWTITTDESNKIQIRNNLKLINKLEKENMILRMKIKRG